MENLRIETAEYIKRCVNVCNESVNLARVNLDYMKKNVFDPYKSMTKEAMIRCLDFVINVHMFNIGGNTGRIRLDEGCAPCTFAKDTKKKNVCEIVSVDNGFIIRRLSDNKGVIVSSFENFDVPKFLKP